MTFYVFKAVSKSRTSMIYHIFFTFFQSSPWKCLEFRNTTLLQFHEALGYCTSLDLARVLSYPPTLTGTVDRFLKLHYVFLFIQLIDIEMVQVLFSEVSKHTVSEVKYMENFLPFHVTIQKGKMSLRQILSNDRKEPLDLRRKVGAASNNTLYIVIVGASQAEN